MSTRAQIRAILQTNLAESGLSSGQFQTYELNDSIQDAYNEIVKSSYCIIKSATINFINNCTYYDFVSLGVTDYMGTIGIFNNNTNWWLRDDIQLRDYQRLRRDWEQWQGNSQFWAGHSYKYVALAPKLLTAYGSMLLWYWASAPTLNENDTPLIATDMQKLIEWYCMADLLDGADEPTKAMDWWSQYTAEIPKYKDRCKNLAKSQILLRV